LAGPSLLPWTSASRARRRLGTTSGYTSSRSLQSRLQDLASLKLPSPHPPRHHEWSGEQGFA
jgi:hypothetical protein